MDCADCPAGGKIGLPLICCWILSTAETNFWICWARRSVVVAAFAIFCICSDICFSARSSASIKASITAEFASSGAVSLYVPAVAPECLQRVLGSHQREAGGSRSFRHEVSL